MQWVLAISMALKGSGVVFKPLRKTDVYRLHQTRAVCDRPAVTMATIATYVFCD